MLKSPVVEILQKIAIPKNVVDNYPFCEWNRNISQKYNCNKENAGACCIGKKYK